MMVKFEEFEKFTLNDCKKYLCEFTDIELINELRNREGTSLMVVDMGTKLTTSFQGPKLLLEISIDVSDDE